MGKDKARKDKLGKESGDATSGMRPQLLGKVRRQAAKVVGTLLQGDADRRASASIKSLIYAPSVVAKKATLALTCQTLKSAAKIEIRTLSTASRHQRLYGNCASFLQSLHCVCDMQLENYR